MHTYRQKYTHTHTYIYIYIYICVVFVCACARADIITDIFCHSFGEKHKHFGSYSSYYTDFCDSFSNSVIAHNTYDYRHAF